MFCMSCGKALPEGAGFCAFCGKPATAPPRPRTAPPPSDGSKALGLFLTLLIVVGGGIAIVVGLVFAGHYVYSAKTSSGGGLSSVTARKQQLVPPSFTVGPGDVYTSSFTVTSSGRVRGDFSSDSNIVVSVSGIGGVYYQSGKVGAGQVDVSLGPGAYIIAFSNRYSIVSTKTIRANIHLEY